MDHHTFDAGRADRLEDAAARYRRFSAEELLWALELTGEETVADLGSGTGFYTDDVAAHAGQVLAVDVQPAMHEHYREKGVPANVDLVTADLAALPASVADVDAALSTMTFHEFATDAALAELADAVVPGGRLVVGDWSAEGDGESGPPLDERYALEAATSKLAAAGFERRFGASRPETFLLVAERV